VKQEEAAATELDQVRRKGIRIHHVQAQIRTREEGNEVVFVNKEAEAFGLNIGERTGSVKKR
jgi:hypothetical protein